jgi:hypothetical protein
VGVPSEALGGNPPYLRLPHPVKQSVDDEGGSLRWFDPHEGVGGTVDETVPPSRQFGAREVLCRCSLSGKRCRLGGG